jgi:hypothetical protein
MTTAKAKIEGLTNTWYGYAVFSALFSIFESGLGVFSIAGAVFGMIVSFILTYFIGRALLRKSSLTRGILILLSGVFGVLGTIATGKMALQFFSTWEFGLLAAVAYSSVSVYMNVKSFRTLMDSQVRAYFS